MKAIKILGLGLFLLAMAVFISTVFIGEFQIAPDAFDQYVENKGIRNEQFVKEIREKVIGQTFTGTFEISGQIIEILNRTNEVYKQNEEWGKVFWDKPHAVSYALLKTSQIGLVAQNKVLFLFLTFGLGIIGALMFIIPNMVLLGPPGIKNNGVYSESSTNRGWVAWIAFVFLVSFYVLLYFYADYIVNWVYIVEPVSQSLFGAEASQWFLYGFLYCVVMLVMGVRMFIKYRHNQYQMVRTFSVLFFQVVFAFLLVNILPLFNLPGVDLKNAWPLDYSFLYDYRMMKFFQPEDAGGYVQGALFILIWGAVFALVIVPLLVYFFGKRWYCSWVCGCGGLAETLGDPYRQHSDKSLTAWKIERYLIHAVLIFAVIMTAWTGIHSFREINHPGAQGNEMIAGLSAFNVREWYGFLIGSIFAGVIGTGFYPIFGNRVWCRFGCPLAAYMGLVQRFKSRFRITTNGGQCISCGNCSTYCEQGIDVRWYAQRGENIVRSSCVGCGVCSAVCPRGVLKLENGPEEKRISDSPIIVGTNFPEIQKGE